MRSVLVVIADVLIHQTFQMAFVENDYMVEQIATAVANPALGDTVLPRTSITCPLGLDAKILDRVDDFFIELCAAIKDQVTRRRVVRKCLAELLNRLCAGRMLGHIEMKNAPPVMQDDKEAIQHSEGQRWYSEEIHGRDSSRMIAQKSRPSLGGLRTPQRFSHPAQHGSFGNLEGKQLQFAMDTRRTPSRVLGDHTEVQILSPRPLFSITYESATPAPWD
jgi:hypothetical protein